MTNQFPIHNRLPPLMDDSRSKRQKEREESLRGFNKSTSIVPLGIGHQSSEQGGNKTAKDTQVGVKSRRSVVAVAEQRVSRPVRSFVSGRSIRRRDNVPGLAYRAEQQAVSFACVRSARAAISRQRGKRNSDRHVTAPRRVENVPRNSAFVVR